MNQLNLLNDFRSVSDEEWLDILIESTKNRVVRGIELPGFPEEELQINSVGNSGEGALKEAFSFYKKIKSALSRYSHPLAESSRVMDFGCGWGRHYRFFLKDVAPENIIGTDIDPELLEVCRTSFPKGSFQQNKPLPPSDIPDNSFDLIYSYSVFSHLSESCHILWVQELARILKPGGLLVATTRGRGFLDHMAKLSRRLWHKPGHEKTLASLVPNQKEKDRAQKSYDAGCFLYYPIGGGELRESAFYGESCVSPGYVERYWSRFLEVMEFDDPSIKSSNKAEQAIIVARKRSAT